MDLLLLVAWISIFGKGFKEAVGTNGDDFIGCIKDYDNKFEEERFYLTNNNRINCKQKCRTNYRYAGMKRSATCACGSEVLGNRQDRHKCSMKCPGNSEETCGDMHHVQVYDTWRCRNNAWCNGSRCTDIDSTRYKCHCTSGFTGKHCNETQTTVASKTTTIKVIAGFRTIFTSSMTSVVDDNKTNRPTTTSTKVDHTSKNEIINASSTEIPYKGDSNLMNLIIISISCVVFIYCMGLLIWCIYKKRTNSILRDSRIYSTGCDLPVEPGTSFEMTSEKRLAHENKCYSKMPEDNLYDCIDDGDINLYENLDIVNRCIPE